jgi:hypothetical protein
VKAPDRQVVLQQGCAFSIGSSQLAGIHHNPSNVNAKQTAAAQLGKLLAGGF